MIKRTFGNFEGSIDPISGTVLVLGLSYGWRGVYTADEIPSKVSFYKRLQGRNNIEQRYSDTISCLEWAGRVLADG